jgi:ferredoxin
MKVVVDVNVCNLHGLCLEVAPEVFKIGDDGVLHVLIETPRRCRNAQRERGRYLLFGARSVPSGTSALRRAGL